MFSVPWRHTDTEPSPEESPYQLVVQGHLPPGLSEAHSSLRDPREELFGFSDHTPAPCALYVSREEKQAQARQISGSDLGLFPRH